LAQIQQLFDSNPANFQVGHQLYSTYAATKNTNAAIAVLDKLAGVPTADLRTLLAAVQGYEQMGQPAKRQLVLGRVVQAASQVIVNTNSTVDELRMSAQAFNMTGQMAALEQAMLKLSAKLPDSPETWYDLAGIQAVLQKTNECLVSLGQAVNLSNSRRTTNAEAADLKTMAQRDLRFAKLKMMPGYVKMIAP
jgi:hypothetical protein